MKRNNFILAIVLFAVFVLGSAAALLLDGLSTGADLAADESYSIIISEISTKNDSIIEDNDGKCRDYIEICNTGKPISLEGFTLTDGKGSCSPFGSAVLETGEYKLVFLADSLTGFALGASGGDCIQLLDPQGHIVTQANTASLMSNQVMVYKNGIYDLSYDASPGYSNDAAGIAAFRKGSPDDAPALIISEVLIGNVSSLPDENGIYSDVLELRNVSEHSINLGRYCLSDSIEMRHRYRLPDLELESGKYVLVYCDSENYVSEGGIIHSNFGLSHGETLILSNNEGKYSAVSAEYCGDDVSLALGEDGKYAASFVSLGYDNTEDGAALLLDSRLDESSPLLISEVLLSSSSVPYMGSFRDVVEIINASSETVSTQGWYLSDGGTPYEYPLPEEKLKPGECMVLICSQETTGFSLSSEDSLRLTAPNSLHAPLVSCAVSEPGKSIGLNSGNNAYSYSFTDVSLGFKNSAENHSNYCKAQLGGGLQISELMSANLNYLKGAYATTADWIELYNSSSKPITLSDYSICDTDKLSDRISLPDTVLGPGEYCVIFLKTDPANLLPAYDVLPFSLSTEGEQLYLSKDGEIVDYVFLPQLSTDESYGRTAGSYAFSLLTKPTPGAENSEAAEKSQKPTCSAPQGCYDDIEYLDIELSGIGDIYYTTDSTTPTAKSQLYTGPVRIDKTTVIRAICIEKGKLASDVLNCSYIINEYDELPVVSVVTDPANLWDPGIGIYTVGPNASPEFPFYGANFWNDWERPANISLFETDGSGFSSNCGIKISGGFTVTMAKKSLACIFRDTYGASELAYPLFGEDSFDTYESFVLRSTGQDSQLARMRDVVVTSLFSEHTDVPVQDYKPVIVYLDGQYWGLHYIREKINEHYLAAHYNVPPETMSVVKLGGWTCPEYLDLVQYVYSHDMTNPEYYDYVCSQMDVDNYIDFIIAEICIANTDNGNVKYFISPEGKWTWFLYDTDMSLKEYDRNSIRTYLSLTEIGSADFTCKTFVAKMIANEEFRDKFLTRLAWQMNNIWSEKSLIAKIDEIESFIIADMPRECERWDTPYSLWKNCVEDMRAFARNRSDYLLRYVQEWFQLSDREMREYGFRTK